MYVGSLAYRQNGISFWSKHVSILTRLYYTLHGLFIDVPRALNRRSRVEEYLRSAHRAGAVLRPEECLYLADILCGKEVK